jgi:hypothetical protein
MINVLIAILIVALVWALTTLLGLPYLVSLIVTVLAAVYLLATSGRPHRRAR